MKTDSSNFFSIFGKPFAESTLAVQALALNGLKSISEVHLKTVAEQAAAAKALVAGAAPAHDISGIRKLMLDSTDFGRDGVTRSFASAQAIAAIAQTTVVSMSELLKPPGLPVNETVVRRSASSKKSATAH